ncbi:hypothetical protein GCM10027447_05820 [Glycomyces halotolerans]
MSDYGYRPTPPPEDGRSYGGAEHRGGSYGSGSGRGDAAWGDSSNQSPNHGRQGWGSQQGSPNPGNGSYSGSARPGSYRGSTSGSAPVGRGSASVGSASVGGNTGRSGRASVGSASVGSASVGSASVGGSRPIDLDAADDRPVSPAGRAGVPGRRRAGGRTGPPTAGDLEENKKAKKKRRRRKIYAGLIAVGVVFVGAITVVGTWFFETVPPLTDLRRDGEPSTFYYVDGETEAAAYGEAYRKQISDPAKVPPTVKEALTALEDRNFYDHGGVDYKGTARALINNVTGGDTQGASTITQQLAGMVEDIRDEISYGRKAKEAVMAMKLEQDYSKDEIITYYLDMAYFGRGAYGVAAASELYFDKPVEELDHAEAAYIVMQVKSPNGVYDPQYPDVYDAGAAEGRWKHAMDSMVEVGHLTQSERDEFAEMPQPIEEFESRGSWGGDTPVGFLTNEVDGYVYDELEDRYGLTKEKLYGAEEGTGGYKIVLTLDKDIQKSLERTAYRGELVVKKDDEGNYISPEGEVVDSADKAEKVLTEDGYWQFANSNEEAALAEYDESMMTAMVAVEPGTGRVLGYYGGHDGFGIDKAGNESPHPPSSTFKIITAATAIEEGASIESWWDASSPRQFDSLTLDSSESCIGSGTYPDCTLRNGSQNEKMYLTLTDAVRQSKNTPMYAIAEDYGVDTILKNAVEMGLTQMTQTVQLYDENGDPHSVPVTYRLYDDFTYSVHGETVGADGEWIVDEATGGIDRDAPAAVDGNTPKVNSDGALIADEDGEPDRLPIGGEGETDPFYYHMSFGQYPTSVRDMAAMYATIANDGVAVETHYVEKVIGPDGEEVLPKRELASGEAMDSGVARDLQWVGSEIDGGSSAPSLDRDFFGKTGTWEASGKDKDGNDYPSSYNAHAWYVGAIPQISIAAWVGNVTSESAPISDPYGNYDSVYGGNTSYPVWYNAINKVLETKDGSEGWEPREWKEKVVVGAPITTDIETVDNQYCGKNPEDPRCKELEEEEEDEGDTCEGPGNGNNQECDGEGGGEDGGGDGGGDTTDPIDPGDGDEECGGWLQPPCTEEPPDEETSPSDPTTSPTGDTTPPGQRD